MEKRMYQNQDVVSLLPGKDLFKVLTEAGTFEEGNRAEWAEQLGGAKGKIDSIAEDNEGPFAFRTETERVVMLPTAAIGKLIEAAPEVVKVETAGEEAEASGPGSESPVMGDEPL